MLVVEEVMNSVSTHLQIPCSGGSNVRVTVSNRSGKCDGELHVQWMEQWIGSRLRGDSRNVGNIGL